VSAGDIHRIGLFLALGGFAALMNFGSRFVYSLALPFAVAVLLAYVTGMAVAFTLFRLFVFPGSPRPIAAQMRDFTLVNLLGIAQTFAIALALVDWLLPAIGFRWHAEAVGHAAAIAAPTVTSWFGHRHLTFAAHLRTTRPDARR
jgi:putative flippase GtrA